MSINEKFEKAYVKHAPSWTFFEYEPNYEAKIKKIEKLNTFLGYSIRLGKVENVPAIFGEAQEQSHE